MAAPLSSRQSSLASQLLQKNTAITPPPVGAGLPAMAVPLSSRQSSLASQLLQKNTAISRLPLWERACPRWQRRWLQGSARWQASAYRKTPQSPASPCGSGLARDGVAAVFKAKLAGKPAPTEKHRNLPLPPVGAGLPAMASLLASSQSSLASQRLQKSIAICPSPCGSGLARDGSAAGFKAELAGKPAPTEKHRNLPLPLWERACPRWRRCWLQGSARWQASAYRKTSQSAPPPVGAGLPATLATNP